MQVQPVRAAFNYRSWNLGNPTNYQLNLCVHFSSVTHHYNWRLNPSAGVRTIYIWHLFIPNWIKATKNYFSGGHLYCFTNLYKLYFVTSAKLYRSRCVKSYCFVTSYIEGLYHTVNIKLQPSISNYTCSKTSFNHPTKQTRNAHSLHTPLARTEVQG